MARTDALAVEGIDKTIERAVACVEAGADMIFPKPMTGWGCTRRSRTRSRCPSSANITGIRGTRPCTRATRLRDGRRRHRAALLLGLPGHEPGCARRL